MSHRQQARPSQRRRLVKKLAAYSAALAGALAAGDDDATAAIIHTDLGPNGVTVREGSFDVDMNADGLIDFRFGQWHTEIGTNTSQSSRPDDDSSSAVNVSAFLGTGWSRGVAASGGFPFDSVAKAFLLEDRIVPADANGRSGVLAKVSSTGTGHTTWGSFLNLQERAFVGVSFGLTGQSRHAGWIEVDASSTYDFTIFGYAYETIHGKSILAGAVPEPPSLVLLAAGATGLAMLRRKRRVSQAVIAPSGR